MHEIEDPDFFAYIGISAKEWQFRVISIFPLLEFAKIFDILILPVDPVDVESHSLHFD
jgi:hypothetical protein